jgi:hypothetical protein
VFRGADALPVGALVEFKLGVLTCMEEMPTGPYCWTLTECVSQGCWLEVFLNGELPGCSVATSQSRPIDGPTPEPSMSLTVF